MSAKLYYGWDERGTGEGNSQIPSRAGGTLGLIVCNTEILCAKGNGNDDIDRYDGGQMEECQTAPRR